MDEHLVCIRLKRADLGPLNHNLISTAEFLPSPEKESSENKNTKEFISWAFRRQLSIDKVDELSTAYFRFVHANTAWSRLRSKSTTSSDASIQLTLRGLLDCTLSSAITQMLFGEHIFHIEPDITKLCQTYVDA